MNKKKQATQLHGFHVRCSVAVRAKTALHAAAFVRERVFNESIVELNDVLGVRGGQLRGMRFISPEDRPVPLLKTQALFDFVVIWQVRVEAANGIEAATLIYRDHLQETDNAVRFEVAGADASTWVRVQPGL